MSLVLVSRIFLVQPAAEAARSDGVIIPGESVAGVRLGSDFSDFERAFPKHPHADTEYPDNGCGDRVYQWVDIDRSATGIFVYLKDDKIYQFSVQTPRFALPNGVALEASEEQVKRAFPKGLAYVLVGSGSAAVGGRDLVYWVDKGSGVAVELYWNHRKRTRLVRSIDIFRKGASYRPEGCISPPQQWRELKQSSPRTGG